MTTVSERLRRWSLGLALMLAAIHLVGCDGDDAASRVRGARARTGDTVGPVSYRGHTIYSGSWAVLVGISHYQRMTSLQRRAGDAESLYTALLAQGFPPERLTLLIDEAATLDAIRTALLDTIRKRARNDDRLIVFLSGHGMSTELPRGGEEGWFLASDSVFDDLPLTALSMTELPTLLARLPPKHVLLLVDAAHADLIPHEVIAPLEAPEDAELDAPGVRLLATGAGAPTVGFEDDRSGFVSGFIEGIAGNADRNHDGLVSSREISQWITTTSGRAPLFGTVTGDGEFVFTRSASTGE